MGAWLEEIPGERSASGGKVYLIKQDSVPERISEYLSAAYEFDGYSAYPENLGELANRVCAEWHETKVLPDDLKLLRSSMFYESRRARFVWGFPGLSDVEYLDALHARIQSLMA